MTQWTPYEGEYSKEYYDVKTVDGSIFEQCYPNAGIFYATNGTEIPEYEITHISKAKPPQVS